MRFVKYSSNGNDFLIFTSCVRDDGSRAKLAQKVCDRHHGIGADGMVVLLPFATSEYEYEWEFYNADGSRASMCGNASRSIGHYAYIEGIAGFKHRFLSKERIIDIEIDAQQTHKVRSNLGICEIQKEQIDEVNPYGVQEFVLVNTGVPHLVGFVPQIQNLPSSKNEILKDLRYRYDANVNLAYVHSPDKISYLTYERGVEDITLACGTGSAAVFAMAFKSQLCHAKATLIPPSKEELELSIDAHSHIFLKGGVQRIALCEWVAF